MRCSLNVCHPKHGLPKDLEEELEAVVCAVVTRSVDPEHHQECPTATLVDICPSLDEAMVFCNIFYLELKLPRELVDELWVISSAMVTGSLAQELSNSKSNLPLLVDLLFGAKGIPCQEGEFLGETNADGSWVDSPEAVNPRDKLDGTPVP